MLMTVGVGHLKALHFRYNRAASEEIRTQLESNRQVSCNPQQANPL